MRILLAEDDHLLARSLATALRENAYAVDVVHDGDAAALNAVLNTRASGVTAIWRVLAGVSSP